MQTEIRRRKRIRQLQRGVKITGLESDEARKLTRSARERGISVEKHRQSGRRGYKVIKN